jgi:Ca2+-binding RTX toxin-like protein
MAKTVFSNRFDGSPTLGDTIEGAYDGMFGFGGNDTLTSSFQGEVYLEGGDGDDWVRPSDPFSLTWGTFVGGNGNDRVYGGAGADVLEGGEGNDVCAGEGGTT